MQHRRISQLAITVILTVCGCSASQSSIRPDDSVDDRVSVPPRHDQEFSHDFTEPGREYGNPVPPVPSKKPVPAPPATGVSRVKSVGWLTDLGSALHSKPASCGSQCGSGDEALVGRCSPVESCVPSSSFSTSVRVQRYRDSVCGGGTAPLLCPSRSIAKSVSGLFHKEVPIPCADEFETRLAPQRRCTPVDDESCESSRIPRNTVRHDLHPGRRAGGSLAEPLEDSYIDESDPGLIVPGELEETVNPDPVPPVPVPHVRDVPHARDMPPVTSPESAALPVPRVPETWSPSSQVVEPPLWPRLSNQSSMHQVSRPALFNPSGSSCSGSAIQMPKVVPKAHR